MGSVIKTIGEMFTGSTAGKRAANAQTRGNQQGIDELKAQYGINTEQAQQILAQYQQFADAGAGQLGALQEGATPEGLNEQFGRITDTDLFQSLRDEQLRAAQGQAAASGQTGHGSTLEHLSQIPTNLALQLNELMYGRSQDLAQTGLTAVGGQAAVAGGLANQGTQIASRIADLFSGSGQARASGILTDVQADAKTTSEIGQIAAQALGYFMSDPRLKVNAERVGKIGDVNVHEWDWARPSEKHLPNVGFMANEILESHPEFVAVAGGFLWVNYPRLLDRLSKEFGTTDADIR